MDIENLILKKARKAVSVSDIVKQTGFSQPYIHRFFSRLTEEGRLIKVGRGRNTRYALPGSAEISGSLKFSAKIKNSNLSESDVFDKITEQTAVFKNVNKELKTLIEYGFTEMLNNAIEHSDSDYISILFQRKDGLIKFEVTDYGIGIFNNIREKLGLKNTFDAILELMKGKRTTMPKGHTGEGIFFTSKAADTLIIQGSGKKIIFNNLIDDIFVNDSSLEKGTRVIFTISGKSSRSLKNIFDEYTDEDFKFSKTKINIKLYKFGDEFISRSQARRIMYGLNDFKTIVLDFKNVHFIGQGFADEIFRVYLKKHPAKHIEFINANDNIEFMIKRTL